MSDKYGETGKEYAVGETTLKVDDEFTLATMLAIVGVVTTYIPKFDEQVSAVAEKIYEEIKKNSINT
jgi:hypothetical protein